MQPSSSADAPDQRGISQAGRFRAAPVLADVEEAGLTQAPQVRMKIFALMRSDARFARFGTGSSIDSKNRAQQLTVDQICSLSGGPCYYSRSLSLAPGPPTPSVHPEAVQAACSGKESFPGQVARRGAFTYNKGF